jgi:hypothetical protein
MPGSLIVTDCSTYLVKNLGFDHRLKSVLYNVEDLERPTTSKLELLQCFLDKFPAQEIIPPCKETEELMREYYGST